MWLINDLLFTISISSMIEIIPYQSSFQQPLVRLIFDIQQKEFNIPITEQDQPDLFIIEEFYIRCRLSFLL